MDILKQKRNEQEGIGINDDGGGGGDWQSDVLGALRFLLMLLLGIGLCYLIYYMVEITAKLSDIKSKLFRRV